MELDHIWSDFEILQSQKHVADKPSEEYFCSFCGGPKVFDGLEIDLPTCMQCGRVDSAYISEEPEWRSGGGEDMADPSRVGAPVNTDHFSAAWGLSTVMRPSGKTYAERRMAKIDRHSAMNHRDRALFHAYANMDSTGRGVLSLPESVMYQAKIKYKTFNEAVLTRGAVRNGIKANCVFQACREAGVSRTTQEIADAFGIPARDLSRTFHMFQEKNPETTVHITTPADMIPRFFSEVHWVPEALRGRTRMKITRICKSLEDCVELMGRTPKAVACAVMYMVLGPERKSELCKICEVSVPTLTKIEAIIKEQQLKDAPT